MRLILSLGLFGFFSLSALSQSNQHLENSTWINGYYDLVPWGPSFNYQLTSTTKYCTNNDDTLVNSLSYLKLYNCDSNRALYRGAIRADSVRWYFVAKDSATEMLLYDFSLMPGDTLKEPVFVETMQSLYFPLVCTAVDTIKVNGIDRRRIQFMYANWIEGVGCSQGLLWDPEPNISNFAINLECYDKNDSLGYTSYQYDGSLSAGSIGCDMSFSVAENIQENGLAVFPNPSQGIFSLRFNNFHENLDLAVYALDGKKLFTAQAKEPEIKIDLSHLPEGLYLLKYTGKSEAGSQVIMIE